MAGGGNREVATIGGGECCCDSGIEVSAGVVWTKLLGRLQNVIGTFEGRLGKKRSLKDFDA